MTPRSSIERLCDDAPVPHADSWPSPWCRPPSPASAAICAALEVGAKVTAAWLATQHRDGIIPPAEKIVLDCLRALQAIPDSERLYADAMMDAIARIYLSTSADAATERRRTYALLKIGGESEPK